MPMRHSERHRTERLGWLRAAVLGANDGIVSTASLLLGVAAAHGTRGNVLVAGVAGLAAGAMAMAAGEYVSVHSQADTEEAELKRERAELKADDKGEHEELTAIYVNRGLDPSLAKQVADQLMAHDALGAHARDELGISEGLRARPISGGIGLRKQFRGWRSHAALGDCNSSGIESHYTGPCNFVAVSRTFGCIGSRRGRSGRDDRRNTRHVLGCFSHGSDRGRRGSVRNDSMTEATEVNDAKGPRALFRMCPSHVCYSSDRCQNNAPDERRKCGCTTFRIWKKVSISLIGED